MQRSVANTKRVLVWTKNYILTEFISLLKLVGLMPR